MSHRPKFAYAQARLQAHHGDRLDAAGWRRIAGVGDFLQLLQAARASSLRPWVLPFNEDTDIHVIELWLRRQFREYVNHVAAWQPASWRDPLRWALRLPDLPALGHLLSSEPVWPWMHEDEALLPFLAEQRTARVEALRASDCAPLLQAWEADATLFDGWLEHWRELWPRRSKQLSAALERLEALLRQQLAAVAEISDLGEAERKREQLRHRLEVGFRRYTQQPAAACFHVGLVCVDLVSLRGQLVRHRLFENNAKDAVH